MQKTFEQAVNEIQSRIFDRVYFIQGEEIFFINELIYIFENTVIDEEAKDFCLKTKYGKESNILQIIEEAKTYPFCSDLQIVLIKEAQDIPDLYKPQSFAILENYLQNPNNLTLLIFVFKNELLDLRTSLAKKAIEYATVINCKKLPENKISAWISKKFDDRQFSIDKESIFFMQALIGNDLLQLDKAINTLITYLGDSRTVTVEIVKNVIQDNKKNTIFDLQNSIAEKNFYKSISIVNKLLLDKKKGDLIPITALLFTFFSKLLIAYQYREKGEKEIANQLQIPLFFIESYSKSLKHFSLPQIHRAIGLLHELDLILKGIHSSSMTELELATNLIYSIFY